MTKPEADKKIGLQVWQLYSSLSFLRKKFNKDRRRIFFAKTLAYASSIRVA